MFKFAAVCVVEIILVHGIIALVGAEDVRKMPEVRKQIRLVSDSEHIRRLKLIPESEDGVLDGLRGDTRLVFYDRKTTPPIFQDWWPSQNSGGTPWPGLLSTMTNHSGNSTEPYGNANREFPWAATAGLAEGDPVLHFVVMQRPAKVRWKTIKRNVGLYDETYLDWTYEDGTVFGELILVGDPDSGTQRTTEVRLRRKNNGKWTATAYRPFPEATDLQSAMDDLVVGTSDRLTIRNRLRTPWTARWQFRNSHPRRVIDETGTAEDLPELSNATVRTLLDRPFKNALGLKWRGPSTNAPTTKAAFHIVPKDYDAAALEVSSSSCSRCHDTVAAHVNDIQQFRDWYGRVRGSDTIFSLHPFKASIAGEYGHNRRDDIFEPKMIGRLFMMEE